jgi:hypothetical protein
MNVLVCASLEILRKDIVVIIVDSFLICFYFAFTVTMLNLPVNAQRAQDGMTVAGRQDAGGAMTQLWFPNGLFVDALVLSM